jgi:hypothetical protein
MCRVEKVALSRVGAVALMCCKTLSQDQGPVRLAVFPWCCVFTARPVRKGLLRHIHIRMVLSAAQVVQGLTHCACTVRHLSFQRRY